MRRMNPSKKINTLRAFVKPVWPVKAMLFFWYTMVILLFRYIPSIFYMNKVGTIDGANLALIFFGMVGVIFIFVELRLAIKILITFISIFDANNGMYGLISAFSVMSLSLIYFEIQYSTEKQKLLTVRPHITLITLNVFLLILISGVAHLLDPGWRSLGALDLILKNPFYSRFDSLISHLSQSDEFAWKFGTKALTFFHLTFSLTALPLLFLSRICRVVVVTSASLFFLVSGIFLELSLLPLLTLGLLLYCIKNIVITSPMVALREVFASSKISHDSLHWQHRIFAVALLVCWIIQSIVAVELIVRASSSTHLEESGNQLKSILESKTVGRIELIGKIGYPLGVFLPNVFSYPDYNAGLKFPRIVVIVGSTKSDLNLMEDNRRIQALHNNFFLYNLGVPLMRCLADSATNCDHLLAKFINYHRISESCHKCSYFIDGVYFENINDLKNEVDNAKKACSVCN
jgi:hypothetical protein